MSINSKHQKVGGQATGETGQLKKDGYAGPGPHKSMLGTKPGVTNHRGYSGPPVAQGTHNG